MVTRSRGAQWASHGELKRRGKAIRLLLTDCDGVLTDGSVYYGPGGEELRRFSVIDGMGVELLRTAGIKVGIVSGEDSKIILARAKKLEIDIVHLGISSKAETVSAIMKSEEVDSEEVMYIGDDINDLSVMSGLQSRGVTACPANACGEIARVSHYRSALGGGDGAFRDIVNWFLNLRGIKVHHYPFTSVATKGTNR